MSTIHSSRQPPRRPSRARAAFGNDCTTTWSNFNQVVLTTTGSNLWRGASGHTYYNVTRQPNGLTDIDANVLHVRKNFKGLALRTVGKGVFEKAFIKSVHIIEAQNSRATERTP